MSSRDDDAPTTPVVPHPRQDDAAATFTSGQLVAGRYRILGPIGRGGMGEVYEAEDQDLRERVALKTLRSGTLANPRALERFRREILLSRRVTHPNVARIFDLGRHESAAFFTMELLTGETLAERLSRGPMGTGEALPIVAQMAAALDAAHAAGVVHRDFKPGNVILVPQAAAPGGVRAVVTDLGLARGGGLEPGTASTTDTGDVLGTPAYMAPEQVEGGEVTAATDLYAFGIVLYEMVTGVRPFTGATPLSTAIKRLSEAPVPPRALTPDLDPRWETAILRCLERDPADRFASAAEVLRVLSGSRAPTSPRGRRRRAAAILAGTVLALGAVAAQRFAAPRPTPMASGARVPPPATAPGRRSVAVLGFKNLSQRASVDWLATALAEMLTTELAAGERLRTIPGEDVARTRIDLKIEPDVALAADTLARIRQRLGADLVVLGAYTCVGEGASSALRLDLRVQDAEAGETIAATAESGSQADLFEVVSRAGQRLRDSLGAGNLSPEQSRAVRVSLPADPEAAQLYSEGLARLRLFDALGARDRLEHAARISPGHPLVHSALSRAWAELGYDAAARAEARKAFDLSAGLPREDRLVVEGRHREAERAWDKAAEIYRTLHGFFPDNLDYGLRLVSVQTSAGEGAMALETIRSLRELPRPLSEDAGIDLAEAQAAGAATDFRRQRAAAERAIAKAAARGARLLAAHAQLEEASALFNLGALDETAAAAERARASLAEVGDRGGVAAARFQLHRARWQQGRLADATRAAEESLSAYREIGNRNREGWALNALAVDLHYLGRLEEARGAFDGALASFKETSDKGGAAVIAINLARLLRDRGELAAARRQSDEALAAARALGNQNYVAHALFGLGEIQAARGDLEAARQAHEQALALFSTLGRKGPVAESHAMLAALLVDAGRAAEAEPLARQAITEFVAEKSAFNETHARAVLLRVLLARGSLAEAREAAPRVAALAAATEHRVFRLEAVIASARVRARADARADAVRELETARDQAKAASLPALELDARLALGEIGLAAGDVAARDSLRVLARDAQARGFGGVARKAAAMLVD